MNIRQLMLDVDKALDHPSILEIAEAIESQNGVEGVCIVVSEVDIETVGMEITIEGQMMNYEEIVTVIEKTGAVVHSLDQVLTGKRMINPAKRMR